MSPNLIQSVLHNPNYSSISIDTRTITPGQCYLAYKGEKFDGHDFVQQAEKNGACALIVDRQIETSLPCLQVSDTNQALVDIAKIKRKHLNVPVIAVTGSCGKTTVKEMLVSVLSLSGNVLASFGNQNNHIGLPLTLSKLNSNHDYAVIEMGMNHLGEIEYLSKIAKPDVALINNVYPVHLEGLGTIERIAQAKAEIFSGLQKNANVVLPKDDKFYDYFVKKSNKHKAVSFALKSNADIFASDILLNKDGTTSFILHVGAENIAVKLNFLGEHNVYNALACAAACHALDVDIQQIASGLTKAHPIAGRMQLKYTKIGALIIDDTYNSNPEAVSQAIAILSQLPQRHKWLVFGDMSELGSDAVQYHKKVGEIAKKYGLQRLYSLGDLAKHAAISFGNADLVYNNKDNLLTKLCADINQDCVILVKGSRSMRMDELVTKLIIKKMEKA